MAIILCPECQGKISDTVNQCVHCGAKITVCRECGSVYTANVETCTNCGFVFQSKVKVEKKEIKVPSANELTESWYQSSPLSKIAFKKNKVIKRVMDALLIIAFIIITLGCFVLDGYFSESNMYIFGVYICMILLGVFTILGTIFDGIKVYLSRNAFSKWCSNKKIGINTVILPSLKTNFDALSTSEAKIELKALKMCVETSFHTYDYANRYNAVAVRVFETLIECVAHVLLLSFFFKNIDILFEYGLKLSAIENWSLLIISLVLLLVSGVLATVAENSEEKVRSQWFCKNFPAYSELYNKYITKQDDYLIDKMFDSKK